MGRYLDWDKILSYNAPFNLIITIRGRGKTYGLRKRCVSDFLKDKSRFCEVVRVKDNIKDVAKGYFDKLVLKNEFPGYLFRTEGNLAYIAKKPEPYWYERKDGEVVEKVDKPEWEVIGYFVDLNTQDNAKKRTFANVKRVIFDEAILPPNKRGRYLQDEYGELVNLIDTIAREEPGEGTKVRVYLLSNACDIVNPYFMEFKLTKEPPTGFTWVDKGLILLYFEKEKALVEAKRNTLVGRLSRGHNEDMITNEFANASGDFLEDKPKDAEFNYGVVFQGDRYGIWTDWRTGLYYVNRKIPNNSRDVYTLTLADNSPNMSMIKATSPRLVILKDMIYNSMVRYDKPVTRERFAEMLKLLGVR